MKIFNIFDIFNFNTLVLLSGFGGSSTLCITTIGTDGTWYGFEEGVFGESSPGATVMGLPLYAYKWKADGEFRMQFGITGTNLIPDLNYIHIQHPAVPDANIGIEDITDYTFNDLELTTHLIGLAETCFNVTYVPVNIHITDFNILRGTK